MACNKRHVTFGENSAQKVTVFNIFKSVDLTKPDNIRLCCFYRFDFKLKNIQSKTDILYEVVYYESSVVFKRAKGLSHTLEQTRNKEPMWCFERNYSFLRDIFPEIIELHSGVLVYRDNLKVVKIQCLEVSRYTTLISLSLTFTECPQIPPVEMTIRLYHDAEVADVISYQNITRLIAPYFSAKKETDQDHKRQANILLYELLSGCVKKRYMETA